MNMNKGVVRNVPALNRTGSGDKDLPGYPIYAAGDDIFNKYQEEQDINPEDISKLKDINEKPGFNEARELTGKSSGSDLDIPGSELDDAMEEIGSEDEENNYYSLGSDDHNDLDENRG